MTLTVFLNSSSSLSAKSEAILVTSVSVSAMFTYTGLEKLLKVASEYNRNKGSENLLKRSIGGHCLQTSLF